MDRADARRLLPPLIRASVTLTLIADQLEVTSYEYGVRVDVARPLNGSVAHDERLSPAGADLKPLSAQESTDLACAPAKPRQRPRLPRRRKRPPPVQLVAHGTGDDQHRTDQREERRSRSMHACSSSGVSGNRAATCSRRISSRAAITDDRAEPASS